MVPLEEGSWERYSRQILFSPIGREGQKSFLKSRVAIIGLGALGTVSAGSLARAGIGFLKLVDRDFVEESNLQRQMLFDEEDARNALPKALAAQQKISKINSEISCQALIEDVNYGNVEGIIKDVDLVLDATDNFEIRYLINEACVKHNIPWIYGACLASSGYTFTILPEETACLACFIGKVPPPPGSGLTCDTAGIISPAVNIVASLQVAEAMKLLSGNKDALQKNAQFFDLWENHFMELEIQRNEECAVCAKREFHLLSGKNQQGTTYLCGRDAVQLLPSAPQKLSLKTMEKKLAPLGDVFATDFLLKFNDGKHEMVIFPDGRAMIKGTSDLKLARTLYARYLGN